MIEQSCTTYRVDLYLAGPVEVAKQIIREECLREGLCVTVSPTSFLYTGGEESGYVVGFINYARFPATNESIYSRAKDLLLKLIEGTHQFSGSIVADDKTELFQVEQKHER